MVLDDCMLHPELVAGVSGAACAHGVQLGDVDLDEVAGYKLLKPARCGPITTVLC